jgi:hypothetical protein
MDKAEARAIVDARLCELRKLPWVELRERYLDRQETDEVTGDSGVVYQLETQAFWDGGKRSEGGDLRVSVAIDDGCWHVYLPLVSDFIIAPDGSFVGE